MGKISEVYSRQDKVLAEEGKVFELEGGVKVRARSPQSLKAREVRRKLEEQEPYRLQIQMANRKRKPLPVETEDRLNKEWFARGVIIGIEDEGPITPEQIIDLFNQHPEFFEDCVITLTTRNAFSEDQLEEDKGN